MARRTKEDAEKTRTALLDAAERVFLRRGVANATLEEIAKEADLTRGAVYWHFENKFAIFRAMFDRVKQPLDLMFESLVAVDDPLDGLKNGCIQVLQLVGKDTHTRNVLTIARLRCEELHCSDSLYAEDARSKRAVALAKFEKSFTRIAAKHKLAKGVTPAFAATALHAFFSGILWDYLRAPSQFPLTTLAPALVENFFRGLLK